MQIRFIPVTKTSGINLKFYSYDPDVSDKFVEIEGIKRPLLLPRGIYCRYINSISANICSRSVCLNYTLKDILNLFNAEIEEDLRNQIGFQEIEDAEIDFSVIGACNG
jgi:hypothetical protein